MTNEIKKESVMGYKLYFDNPKYRVRSWRDSYTRQYSYPNWNFRWGKGTGRPIGHGGDYRYVVKTMHRLNTRIGVTDGTTRTSSTPL